MVLNELQLRMKRQMSSEEEEVLNEHHEFIRIIKFSLIRVVNISQLVLNCSKICWKVLKVKPFLC